MSGSGPPVVKQGTAEEEQNLFSTSGGVVTISSSLLIKAAILDLMLLYDIWLSYKAIILANTTASFQ